MKSSKPDLDVFSNRGAARAKNRAGFAGGSKPREVEAMTTRYFPEAQARTYRAAVAQTAKALRREI